MNATMDEKGHGDPKTPDVRLTLAGAAELAVSLHGSLNLGEILRGCRRVLCKHILPERINLVVCRGNKDTVTIYSMDNDGTDYSPKPKVVALEPSRLSQCLSAREKMIARLSTASAQDAMEGEFLLHPGSGAAIYLPLVLAEKLKGALVVALPDRQGPTAGQMALLDYLSHHLTLALENSEAYYLEHRRTRQLAMIGEIAKAAVQFESLDDFLQSAAELLRPGFDYDVIEIWTLLPRQEILELRGFASKLSNDRPVDATVPEMVEKCQHLEQPVCSNNLLQGSTGMTNRPGIASQLVVPIRLRGKLLGILSLESIRLDAFLPEDINIMEGVASVIASAFDTLRAFENLQQSSEYMKAILDSAQDLSIFSTDSNGYVITGSIGSKTIFQLSPQEILGKDILTLFTDSRFRTELAVYIESPGIPVLERKRLAQTRDGAEVYLDVILQRVYDLEKRPIGSLGIVRDVTETVLLQQRLESLSVTDDLTGLLNQRRFFAALASELERSSRFDHRLSLCFMDLDGFKNFNDTQGHIEGDQALKDTADLMRHYLRAGIDSCFRYGGDEFVIILPETTQRNAHLIADRIRVKVSDHFQKAITVSMGIAEFSDNLTVEALVTKADKAMYQSKFRGGNCVTLAEN